MAPYFVSNTAALQSPGPGLFTPVPRPFLPVSSEFGPQLNVSEDGYQYDYNEEYIQNKGRSHSLSNFIPHESICRCTHSEFTGQNAALTVPSAPPGFDYSLFCFGPKHNLKAMSKWNICHLLSLPKELRLEIWTYVLTDPSVPDLTVEITRAPHSPTKSSLRFPTPCLKASLRPQRNAPIGLNLLLTNKFVYEEALPVLYRSVKSFAALDLEGIFPLFLETLSPYGRSLIRNVKLRIPSSIYDIDLFGDPSTFLFHWAVTCAQVAKVENLRDVEVEGFEDHDSKRVRSGILNPLVKIKAKKIFVGKSAQKAQVRLAEAQAELLAQASARKLSTEAERVNRESQITTQKIPSYTVHPPSPSYPFFTRHEIMTLITPHAVIEEDLSSVKGLEQFEKELDKHTQARIPEEDVPEYGEWDIVSVESGVSTPIWRATSRTEEFVDSALTLIDECDADSILIVDRTAANKKEF